MAHHRKLTADKLRKHVHESFEHLRKALDIRERLLTRQIDVLANSSPRPNAKSNGGRPLHLIDQMKFLTENEANVLDHIRNFGKFNIDNYKFYADPTFAIEDYICPDVDHELMYKCLHGRDDEALLDADASPPVVVLDFGGQLISRLNEQRIVQMTVEQSQELIDQQSKSLRKFELFMSGENEEAEEAKVVELDSVESIQGDEKIARILIDNLNETDTREVVETAAEVPVTSAPKISKKNSKRKIKINQYNGTINLKNISNLTINTSCRRSNSTKKTSNPTITSSKTEESVRIEDHQPNSYNCEFYNRLLNEIKNSLDSTSSAKSSPTTPSSSSQSAGSTPTTTPPFDCNRMLFQNIRNLKINLPPAAPRSSLESSRSGNTLPSADPNDAESLSGDEQPVQIEQWLKQIITQTEVEPAPPNSDILEHRIIPETNNNGFEATSFSS